MSTLRLDPAVAAARRAAPAASMPASKAIVAPERTVQAAEASPAQPSKRDRLKTIWPHLFDRKCVKPLKIGIRFDIAPHLSADEQKLLANVLGRWCARKSYLRACLQPVAHRVDLAGNLTPIKPKHAAFALPNWGAQGIKHTSTAEGN